MLDMEVRVISGTGSRSTSGNGWGKTHPLPSWKIKLLSDIID
jgi:hypothetical protein